MPDARILIERVEHDFTLHPPATPQVGQRMDSIRSEFKGLALRMAAVLPEGRELSTCLSKLEEACFWGIAAIARGPDNQV